jgi:hypothetical protein
VDCTSASGWKSLLERIDGGGGAEEVGEPQRDGLIPVPLARPLEHRRAQGGHHLAAERHGALEDQDHLGREVEGHQDHLPPLGARLARLLHVAGRQLEERHRPLAQVGLEGGGDGPGGVRGQHAAQPDDLLVAELVGQSGDDVGQLHQPVEESVANRG